MEFGRLDFDQLHSVNWKLPNDHGDCLKDKLQPHNTPLHLFIGATSWARKEWQGTVFPLKCKPKEFLKFYAFKYNTIELNATYYQTPTINTIKEWRNLVNDGFKFCPKFPEIISQYKSFKNCNIETNIFLDAIFEFQENLGPCFIQLPSLMKPEKWPYLFDYLTFLPKKLQVFVEMRHCDWFEEPFFSEISNTLKSLNKNLVLTDVAGRRDVLHMHVLQNQIFLRFVGNNLHPSDLDRIKEWINKFMIWQKNGLKYVYIFVHQPNEKFTPLLIDYIKDSLRKIWDANSYVINPIIAPEDTQTSLF